ncbi:MAG: Dam family site-specific DNA-(adenine-N6)-methyltransferase [Acidobacteria bacterium]|nr:Dam family site-specific DNA-(adenine-N6)-methyltransferase [Acidobacteriota bacterium]MBU4307349.1 Dam family site-specific DNA-(adenine-N6)-methyltransferase [Acidobacteriota bacterium]MCG2810506.1 Dam family site-specific DNA-(adenine-N6)-methyltransferase [Candidatus Aminicenantes bacterium]
MGMNIPHPIPYQGSKRNLADDILRCFPANVSTLYEPFAGSAAISLAAAAYKRARTFQINDLNKPLIDLWRAIVNTPDKLAKEYEDLWHEQLDDPKVYYNKVRDEFNLTGRPDYFLYLLARCVKASVRYNANGEFNQSPDNRRKGTMPVTMREQILGASSLLKGKTTFSSKNYRDVVTQATESDLVYMDPPYQGVCGNKDTRYLASVQFCEFVEVLEHLSAKHIRYLVSYDGRTGDKVHGVRLPEHLNLTYMELQAGRSTQATLLGRDDATIESLYLSLALADELTKSKTVYRLTRSEQMCLFEARS